MSATSPIVTGTPEHTLYARNGRSAGTSSARRLAAATSRTWTKSRACWPSSNTLGGRPAASADRKIEATPEYGVSRGIRGP